MSPLIYDNQNGESLFDMHDGFPQGIMGTSWQIPRAAFFSLLAENEKPGMFWENKIVYQVRRLTTVGEHPEGSTLGIYAYDGEFRMIIVEGKPQQT